ncbi:MAG: GNAT family N-acetyltransferase [Bacteroidia bacterium]
MDINFNPFPVIETERLLLREITLADAPDFFLLRSDKETMKYIGKPLHQTVADTEALIQIIIDRVKTNAAINWGISLKEDPKFLGSISYHDITKEHFRAEVGYMLHPSYRKKGITNEALKAVLDFGFAKLKLHSIEAKINPSNTASANLLKKHGFVKEAYFKQNYFFEGSFQDTEIYSLLAQKNQ